jgi:peptidoglycan hydrolase CwlO-like protein
MAQERVRRMMEEKLHSPAIKAAEEKVSRLDDEIAEMESKLTSAKEKRDGVATELEAAEVRLRDLAVAIVGEEPAALEEEASLLDKSQTLGRKVMTFSSAVSQLEDRIATLQEQRSEAERMVWVAKSGKLHAMVASVADATDEAISTLKRRLERLEELRTEYHRASHRAGNPQTLGSSPTDYTAEWLSVRLGRKCVNIPQNPAYTPRSLAEGIGVRRPEEKSA